MLLISKRINFFKNITVVAALASLTVSFTSIFQSSSGDRPNILWITIEDTSPQFIGAYGNADADTPNIDQLAKEGVRFTNAFSTNTVCSPSRSSIITGSRTVKMGTGNHRSNYSIPDFIKGFPYYLQQQGYYTSNNSKTDYNVGNVEAFTEEAWNESSDTAGWWKRKKDQPFFSVFNIATSHQSRTMTWPYEQYVDRVLNEIPESERIPETGFPMPPFYKDSPPMRKQFARVYNSIKLTDTEIGGLLDRLEEDGLKENTIIFMYADHGEGVPRGKTNGIDFGYRVPFIVWFPKKYEDLSPWGTGGSVTDELVDFEDLAPTMVSLVGGTPPDHMKGRVLMGKDRSRPVNHLMLSSGRADNGIDWVRSITTGDYTYSRNYMAFLPQIVYSNYFERGAITKQMREDFKNGNLDHLQKSLFEPRPAEYLFNVKEDPWQTNNLAGNPESKPILKKMRDCLKSDILAVRDVMFLPEYELEQISKTTTPYKYRLDKEKYPIDKIYNKAISLSGRRGKNIAARQAKLLSNSNKIIRYWAAAGLLSQPSEFLKPNRDQILKATRDSYPPVQITALAIAYQQQFGSQKAAEHLKNYVKNDNKHLALMAINYLCYVKRKEPFVETIKSILTAENIPHDVEYAGNDFLLALELKARHN